jgi:hypothetical protein
LLCRFFVAGTALAAAYAQVLDAALPSEPLPVYLFDYGSTTHLELELMKREANFVFAKAGVFLRWINCVGPNRQLECGHLCSSDVILRLSRKGRSGRSLGFTIGMYATACVPEVRYLAREHEVAAGVLLGYAVAHEIGHVLLGPLHSRQGPMCTQWTGSTIQALLQRRVTFDARQSLSIRTEAKRRMVACRHEEPALTIQASDRR